VNHNVIATIFIFGTPVFALVAGILASILRVRGEQRLLELAQRERLAAIEKGVDIRDWPPLMLSSRGLYSAREVGLRRVQGLTIGGIVAIGLGIGVSIMLMLIPDGREAWPIGILATFLGVALLLSARVIRRGLDSSD
jgi:hypothetical protein